MRKIFLIGLLCCVAIPALAGTVRREKVLLQSGKEVEGYLLEVADDSIRMYADKKMIRLRFRNMDIRSADYFRNYNGPRDLELPPEIFNELFPAVADPGSAPEKPKTVKDFVIEGMDLMAQGEFQKAASAFGEAIALSPNDPELYLFRVGAYQEAGDFDKAITDVNWLIERSPQDGTLYARRGWLYQLAQKPEPAITDYSRAIEADPQNTELLLDRFNIYGALEQWDLALQDLNTILEINPAYGEGYLERAFVHFEKENFRAAWEDVHKTLQNGIRVPSKFIDSLKEKMPDPVMAERKEKARQEFIAKVNNFLKQNVAFLVIVGLAILAAVVFMLIPAQAPKPLSVQQKEEEEQVAARALLRPVDLRKARNGRRFCAEITDIIMISVLSWGVDIVVGPPVFALAFAVLLLVKDAFMGVSLGKALYGLRVVDEHGYRSTIIQGCLRNFSLGLPVLVFFAVYWSEKFLVDDKVRLWLLVVWLFFLVETISILWAKRYGRRIGDHLAGTYVHDLEPERKEWPFWILLGPLVVVFLVGTIAMNMFYNKAFLYKLNPLRYYDVRRDFSFKVPKGWGITGEGEGGIVMENAQYASSIILMVNQEVSQYALELCVNAFTKAMEDGGMVMRTRDEITISGRPAIKVGFMEEKTDTAYLLVYFKEEEKGPLFILQGTTPRANMRYVMADSMDLITSFHFE